MKTGFPSVGTELHTIMNLMRRNAEHGYLKQVNREAELTAMQSRIIGFLLHNSRREIFQRDIEHEFSVRRATASVLLSTMEQRDLIKRESVPYDARLKKICLTEKANRLGETVKNELNCFEEMLIQDIPAADMAVFFRVTEQIKNNLENHLSSEIKREGETETESENQWNGGDLL